MTAATAGAACRPAPLFIEIDPKPGAASTLVVIESSPDAARSMVALDTSGRGQDDLPVFGGSDPATEIVVIRFDFAAPLDALALAPGKVMVPGTGEPSRALPVFLDAEQQECDRHRAQGWVPLDMTAHDPSGYRLPPLPTSTVCASFDVQKIVLDVSDTTVRFIEPIGGGRALVGTNGGYVGLVSTTPSFTVQTVNLNDALPTWGGLLRSDGRFWFSGGGAVTTGSLDGRLFLTADPVTGPDPTAAIGSAVATSTLGIGEATYHFLAATPDPEVIFALALEGAFQRFDRKLPPDRQWTHLAKYPDITDTDSLCQGLVGLSTTTAMIVRGDFSNYAVRIEGTRASTLTITRDVAAGGFCALTDVPGLGVVAGPQVGGQMFAYDETHGRWRLLGTSPLTAGLIEAIAPYENGFFYGGYTGFVGQFVPPSTFCDGASYGPEVTIIAALGSDLLLGTDKDASGHPGVYYLKRKPAGP
jgi:hypothetical protein